MPKQYYPVTQTEFEALLSPQGFALANLKHCSPMDRTVELVYGKRVDQGHSIHGKLCLSLRIYTGLNSNGTSRDCGTDAIRVALWMRRPSDGQPVEIGGSKKVLRLKTWAKNLQQRLDTWLEYLPKDSCPNENCGAPLTVRTTKDKNRKFIGCSNYPACKYTRNV